MTHPRDDDILVVNYLNDLELALSDADPEESASVLSAVREHIEVELAERREKGQEADVRGILEEIGPVERIARESTRARSGHFTSQPVAGKGYARFETDFGSGFLARPGAIALLVGALAVLLSPFVIGGILGIALLGWLARNSRQNRLALTRNLLRYSIGLATLSIVVAFFAVVPILQ